MIREVGGRFVLFSKDGKKVLGYFDTKADAEKHEQEVNYFKHNDDKKEK